MTSLLAVALVCATLVYLSREWKPVLTPSKPVDDTAPMGPDDVIPGDLLAVVNRMSTGTAEGDDMMREQTVALLYEKYEELGHDWNNVRMWSVENLPDADSGWHRI